MFSSEKVSRLTDHARIEAEFLHRYHGNYYDGLPRGELRSRVENFDGGAGLTYSNWSYPSLLGYDPVDYVRIVFPLEMRPAEFTLGGDAVHLTELGHVVAAGRMWKIRRPQGSDSIALRLDSSSLARKLGAYLGEEKDDFELEQPTAADPAAVRELRVSIIDFMSELDLVDHRFQGRFTSEWIERVYEQVLTTLCPEVTTHATPAAPSDIQLGRVEQYLAEHFAGTVTLEKLAELSGVSAHSVHHHFRSRHGCTVRQYVERIRLEMARLRLRVFKTARPVEDVALECGFGSVAALQTAYRGAYGDRLPS